MAGSDGTANQAPSRDQSAHCGDQHPETLDTPARRRQAVRGGDLGVVLPAEMLRVIQAAPAEEQHRHSDGDPAPTSSSRHRHASTGLLAQTVYVGMTNKKLGPSRRASRPAPRRTSRYSSAWRMSVRATRPPGFRTRAISRTATA